jgi:hypothetical protein
MVNLQTKASTFAIRTSRHADPKLQKSLLFANPRKIKKQKISNASKKVKLHNRTTQDRQARCQI